MYYLNNNLKNLVRIFDQNERKNYLRLDLNENPGGLPQDFIDSILPEITPQLIAQYPETRHFSEVLAKHLDTTPEHLCLVNGSAEGIRYISLQKVEKLSALFRPISCSRYIQKCITVLL